MTADHHSAINTWNDNTHPATQGSPISPTGFGLVGPAYAQALGWTVGPICHPDAEGACACGWHHGEKEVGKAPLTPGGHAGFSSDPVAIDGWLAERPVWAAANVGVDLARSGLLVADLDSPEAIAEFDRWSPPPTATASTGKGEH